MVGQGRHEEAFSALRGELSSMSNAVDDWCRVRAPSELDKVLDFISATPSLEPLNSLVHAVQGINEKIGNIDETMTNIDRTITAIKSDAGSLAEIGKASEKNNSLSRQVMGGVLIVLIVSAFITWGSQLIQRWWPSDDQRSETSLENDLSPPNKPVNLGTKALKGGGKTLTAPLPR